MSFSLRFIRISLAVLLTLVIGFLPHHHHHGEPCWQMDECKTHHPLGEEKDNCPSMPCKDASCYLQTMKTFIQAERPEVVCPLLFSSVLPEQIFIVPSYIELLHHPVFTVSYPLSPHKSSSIQRRGPPHCS